MKINLILAIIFFIPVFAFNQDIPIINASELNLITGVKWIGSLTYLDYGSNKNVSIPVELSISQSSEDTSVFIFNYEYTKEPDANGYDTVKISSDGKFLNNEEIVFKSSGNTLKIITEELGEDDDRNAKFRHTYLINNSSFTLKKEVRFSDGEEFIIRNEYKFER
ncbi:MAG: hypothetical protein M3R36_14915 [Bacteroidota bacterium]|nr:hypothetical protein [Bacteroidota bacterium]